MGGRGREGGARRTGQEGLDDSNGLDSPGGAQQVADHGLGAVDLQPALAQRLRDGPAAAAPATAFTLANRNMVSHSSPRRF